MIKGNLKASREEVNKKQYNIKNNQMKTNAKIRVCLIKIFCGT